MVRQSTKRNGNAAPVDILSRPGVTPKELFEAKVLPLSLNLIYAACNTGEIECFRIGKKVIIPTAPLKRKFQIEAA